MISGCSDRKKMIDWKEILAASIRRPGDLSAYQGIDASEVEQVSNVYPMLVNPYYLSLMKESGAPLALQAIPDLRELSDLDSSPDPLCEDIQSPVPGLIHRYPDRVVLLVSNRCAMYCRHCMRKRRVGLNTFSDVFDLQKACAYISENPLITEAIVSGGDPFLLDDESLEEILSSLRSIPHLEVIRIHTRIPCVLPQRVTPRLAGIIRKFHPVFINIQFNHSSEITQEASSACAMLADAGIALGCQSVLLKGVNDSEEEMRNLMKKLMKNRIRPYYLHHPDPVKGTSHFRLPVKRGLEIMASLRGHVSGMCVPYYMIDLPGGGGKTPLLPEYVVDMGQGWIEVRNFEGDILRYPDATCYK